MKKTKIAFFDVDGTLIDMKTKTISKKTVATLIELKRNNVLICIATGRPLSKVPQFKDVEFDVFLTFNGSYCCTMETRIFHNPIPKRDVFRIVENARKINRPVSVATLNHIGANGTDQDLDDYYAISKQTVTVTDNFDSLIQDEVYQVMLGLVPSEYDAVLEGVEGAEITAWWHRAVDIIPRNGGKGLGVEKVLEHYNLTKEMSIAFGDGTNDIEMLNAVGTGIAMGNATHDVKSIADAVCGSVEEDGIYDYCIAHGLVQKEDVDRILK